jgi:hypothetical protein
VVDEPVDQGGSDHRVAEDLAPLLEAAVAGDDDRAALVASGDEREEEVGCLSFERQVADFVNDEELVALEPAQLLLELVAILRGLQLRDPFLGGGEGDAVAALTGFEAERDREDASMSVKSRCLRDSISFRERLPGGGRVGGDLRACERPS